MSEKHLQDVKKTHVERSYPIVTLRCEDLLDHTLYTYIQYA